MLRRGHPLCPLPDNLLIKQRSCSHVTVTTWAGAVWRSCWQLVWLSEHLLSVALTALVPHEARPVRLDWLMNWLTQV